MKYTGLLLLTIASPFALGSEIPNMVIGKCSYTIAGNDTTSNIFTRSGLDSRVKVWEDRERKEPNFTLLPGKTHKFKHNYERIVAYWKDVQEYQHYQIVAFKDDIAAREEAKRSGLEFKRIGIDRMAKDGGTGLSHVKIKYNSDVISSDFDGNFKDFQAIKNATASSSIQIKVIDAKRKIYAPMVKEFDSDGKVEFDFEFDAPFSYKAYHGDGFIGSFRGDVTKSDAKEAETDSHKAVVEAKCSFYNPFFDKDKQEEEKEQKETTEDNNSTQVNEERNTQKEDDRPFTTEFGSVGTEVAPNAIDLIEARPEY